MSVRRTTLAVLLGSCLLAACATAAPEIAPLAHPYRVVLLPVEGADDALAATATDAASPEEGEVPFALDPETLRRTIRDGIVNAGVFSDIVVVTSDQLTIDEFTDAVAAATPLARRERADLILRVRVDSARLQDLGPNDSKFWSAFAWFMVPAPIWFVGDRTYATTLSVHAELFDPEDSVKPTASIVAGSDDQVLDLWDRGVSPLVVVVPPAWLEGDIETVSQELTTRAVTELMTQLVEELRTRDIPSRFDVAVAWEGRTLVVEAASRRRLRSLDVRIGDRVLRSWAERETATLIDASAARGELTVYRARVEIPAGAEELVRVIAEDEAGGREVRSVPSGGGR